MRRVRRAASLAGRVAVRPPHAAHAGAREAAPSSIRIVLTTAAALGQGAVPHTGTGEVETAALRRAAEALIARGSV